MGNGCGTAVPVDSEAAVRRRLRAALCPPPQGQDPAEGDGCRLCPPGWPRRGRKCYWVADGFRSWNGSREDCAGRGTELLTPGDCAELKFIEEIAKNPSKYFWIGLSFASAGTGWTRLSRSCPERSGLPPGSPRAGKGCGALKGGRILAESCGSALPWICQKAAVDL
uniref:Killer cell lectin-like receptor subfamily B member 1B allele A n=1 Tax=Dromaius novaehollandiae TaxID=8790 RepID=A0A8C4K0P7_DRONO|nr:killer cell lectin-like receptor subfamily B member 1B allele A [Dromaius novaehollandiae]